MQLIHEAPAPPLNMGLAPLGGMGGMGMMGMPMGNLAALGAAEAPAPPSTCVLMKNMFDPNGEDEKNDPEFFEDLMEGVKEECVKYGSVVDAKFQPTSAGHVYMMFTDVAGAAAAVAGLNNRWFAGKQISAAHCTEDEYKAA